MRLVILSVISALSLMGCVSYEPVELISVDNAELHTMSAEGAEFEIKATINNPNDYKINVTSEDIKVFINGKELGSAAIVGKLTLDKSAQKSYSIKFKSAIPSTGEIDLGMFTSMLGGVKIKAEGNIRATAKGISKTVPLSFEQDVQF